MPPQSPKAPSQSAAPPCHFVSIVSDDDEECDNNAPPNLWKRQVVKGDRPKTLFLTWPHSSISAFRKPATMSRKDLARAIEIACWELGAKVEGLGVFQERHQSGDIHYHALINLKAKTRSAWELDTFMFRLHKAKTYTEVVIGSSAKPQNRILQYLLVPTPAKLHVDSSPYVTKGISIPEKILDEAAKARKKLDNSAAAPDEVLAFLGGNREITSYDDLQDYLDKANDDDLRAKRVNKYVTNNIARSRDLVAALIARRDRKTDVDEAKKTPAWYLEKAITESGNCQCPKGTGVTTLAQDMDFLVGYHGVGNVSPFFVWADRFFSGTLPSVGRPRNVHFAGSPGSGKSTLSDLISFYVPKSRIFSPVIDSSAPYAKMRSHHLLSICDDWRFTAKAPVTCTLQWLEGRSFAVDVKGEAPIPISQGPFGLFSSNPDEKDSWRRADIDAFNDRCYLCVLHTPVPRARRTNISAKMENCPYCRSYVLAKYVASVRRVWDRIKGDAAFGAVCDEYSLR